MTPGRRKAVQVSVYPALVPDSHVLASVNDVFNAVFLRGDIVGDTLYYGRREVGEFLSAILRRGATEDGGALLQEVTGEPLSARAMLEYFEPLRLWLAEQNAGRTYTCPEL